jgi:tryptophanyl-tRNA synthetase
MSRILSGIRPSGQLHLGNYLGAVQQWIKLQDQHEAYFMIADLHAITTPYVAGELQEQVRSVVLDYLAAGLDPDQAAIFVQSRLPAHSELMWLLNTLTPVGELERMVQYKEKSAAQKDGQNAGLLNYPILMAADILAYKAERVPVGEDQVQHVELARDLAKKFNRLYDQTFPEPTALLVSGKRIMSLTNPLEKMSKTGNGGILLTENHGTILAKLQKAVTSGEPRVIREAWAAAAQREKSPDNAWRGDPNLLKQFHGVRNLFTILMALATPEEIAPWQAAAQGGTLKFAQFKPALADIIDRHFAPFREKRAALAAKPREVEAIVSAGTKKASEFANATLLEVQQKMGLR